MYCYQDRAKRPDLHGARLVSDLAASLVLTQAVIIFLLILALYLLLMAGYAYSIRVMALGATGRL